MARMPAIERSNTSFSGFAFLDHHWTKVDGEYLINRYRIIQTPWFALFFTGIKPDTRPHPHDHDRTIISWKVRGGYTERVFTDPASLAENFLRVHRRWSWSVIPMKWAHEIVSVEPGTWTLTINGPYRGDQRSHWVGHGRKVHWRAYDAFLNEHAESTASAS